MISIILPVLNEGDNLKVLIPMLKKILGRIKYEIIVVDDNSADNTSRIMKQLSRSHPLKYILRKNERSLSSAVIDGFRRAVGEYYIVMDSDMSHPPEIITRIIRKLQKGYDVVVASRFVKGAGVVNWAVNRKAISYFGTMLAKPLVKIQDPLAGYFGINRDVVRDITLNPLGFKILLEILVKGKYKKVTEIPFIFLERYAGESKADWKIYFQYYIHLVKLYFYWIKTHFKKVVK